MTDARSRLLRTASEVKKNWKALEDHWVQSQGTEKRELLLLAFVGSATLSQLPQAKNERKMNVCTGRRQSLPAGKGCHLRKTYHLCVAILPVLIQGLNWNQYQTQWASCFLCHNHRQGKLHQTICRFIPGNSKTFCCPSFF